MFGNLKGWLMSAVIAVGIAALIVWKGTIPSISTPSGRWDAGLKSAALGVDPGSLGIAPGTNNCDGGEIYRQAIDEYKKYHFKYDDYDKHVKQARIDNPPAVQMVIKAADCSRATLFALNPEEIINYDNVQQSIEGLFTAGSIANNIGLLYVTERK